MATSGTVIVLQMSGHFLRVILAVTLTLHVYAVSSQFVQAYSEYSRRLESYSISVINDGSLLEK